MGDCFSSLVGVLTACLCFPSDAVALRPNGEAVQMKHLRVGDEVIVIDGSGVFRVSRIFAFGHQHPHVHEQFVTIIAVCSESRHTFRCSLTPDHQIPLHRTDNEDSEYLRARDVELGDTIYVANDWCEAHTDIVGAPAQLGTVIAIQHETKMGLFAPLTEAGTIVVNGVAASCFAVAESSHSDSQTVSSAVQNVCQSVGLNFPSLKQGILLVDKEQDVSHDLSSFFPDAGECI